MRLDRPNSWVKPAPAPTGPPRIWWLANAVAAGVVAVPLLVWGLYALLKGYTFLPLGRSPRFIEFYGRAAALLGFGLTIGSLGVFAHMFLTCIDALKWRAEFFAMVTGVAFLVCLIAALVLRLI